jgi:hypothetical protein
MLANSEHDPGSRKWRKKRTEQKHKRQGETGEEKLQIEDRRGIWGQ